MVKVLSTVPVLVFTDPKSVWSAVLGLRSLSAMESPLPTRLISGIQVLLRASPEIVQPLPPLPVDKTKLALSAAEAQYLRPAAPIVLPVTVPALKPLRVAS